MAKFNINDSLDSTGSDPLWDDMDMLEQVEKSPASAIQLVSALGWQYFRALASVTRLKQQGKIELHEKKWRVCSKGMAMVIPLEQKSAIPLELEWKAGDSFIENGRRGTLIKPVESRQVSNAWLADVNGCQTIVSLGFIERPPKDDDGQYLLFPLEQQADEPPDPDDFGSEEAYLKAWAKWESTHINDAKEFQRRNSRTQANVVLRETTQSIPLEQKSQFSPHQSIPLELEQKPKPTGGRPPGVKRAAKNCGSGYLRMRECNKKRNASKGKQPDVYWVYYYSFTDEGGTEHKRSVSVKKSLVDGVQELIDKNTPYSQILKSLNKENSEPQPAQVETLPLEQNFTIPLEQKSLQSKQTRARKGCGSGYLRMRECNKKRNAAQGKPPDVYWVYYYSYTDQFYQEHKRSVSVNKSQINFVQELIDKSTPYHQILKSINKENKEL